MELRKALPGDLEAVVGMYAAAIGQPGCVWDENYPTRREAEGDLEGGNLYVYENDGEVIGAVSVLAENELDDAAEWQVRSGDRREIVRVVISRAHQGGGLAARMLEALFARLAGEGCRAIHLAVAKANPPAMNTYRRLGFAFLREAFLFGHDYYLCEKPL